VPVARDCVCDSARSAGVAEHDVASVGRHVADVTLDAVRAHRLADDVHPVVIAFGVVDEVFEVTVDTDQPSNDDTGIRVPIVPREGSARQQSWRRPSPRPPVSRDPGACSLELTGAASRVPQARKFVVSLLYALGNDAAAPVAELAVSELVTNTVIHTDGGATVTVSMDDADEVIRVEVCDTSRMPPQLLDPIDEESVGRGLLMVDAIVSRWGHRERPAGKTVWFELEGKMRG
jgi:hypothetical protein